ncbi:MAG: Type 1 glutamine amidotransferase-like domain-containing protein [Culicoidibacterales bacterium]
MMQLLLSQNNFDSDWAFRQLTPHLKPGTKVLILPFSFSSKLLKTSRDWEQSYGKNGTYYHDIVAPFLKYGIFESDIKWVNFFEDSPEKIIDLMNKCEVVFLPGGLPQQLQERIIKKELVEALRTIPKLVIGVSAGALVQLPYYSVSPDRKFKHFEALSGLAITDLPFLIEVHYSATDRQQEFIRCALAETTHLVYALSNSGGLFITDGVVKELGKVTRFHNK